MFMTYHYGIRNKKTQEYDYIGTYSPLEGEWIGYGTNPDGSPAEWDVVGIKWAEIHTDEDKIIGLSVEDLRRINHDLMTVFENDFVAVIK